MKKRFLAILLATAMVFAMMPTMAFAAAADHAIKLVLVKDTTTVSGKEVLRVDFMYKSGEDAPMNQMVYLKYDVSKLFPVVPATGANGSTVLTNFQTNWFATFSKNAYAYEYNDPILGPVSKAAEGVLYSYVSGNDGYICWKITEADGTPAFADYTRVSSIFFGLGDGVSFDAIPAGAIAYSDPDEDYAVTSAVQAAQITANGGAVNLEYNKKDGSADTMTTAPVIVAGDGVTFAKEAITGTVAITASAKVGQKLTATVNGAPAGYTVTWYRGETEIGTGLTYTTEAADIGAEITAKVTHNDYSGALTSNVAAVADKTLTALTITTAPTKVSYVEGQDFDPTGMVVKAEYDNGTEDTNFTDYEIVGGEELTAGTTKVTIQCGTVTVDQAITVVAKEITNVALITPPTTTEYVIGDTADYSGVKVKVTYNDDSSVEIIDPAQLKFEGFDSAAYVASQTITVKYGDEVAGTYSIKVDKKTLTASDFTVTIPTGKKYDGNAVAATVETELTGVGAITVKYNGSATAPADAGSYPVSYTVAETDTYKAFTVADAGTLTIAKADSTITATDKSVKVGKTVELNASVVPDGTLTYASGDETVATVSAYGVVEAKKVGTAVITISYAGNENYNAATKKVTVTVNELDPQVFADSFAAAKSVTYGDAAFNKPASLTTGTGAITYKSSNENVATVSADGTVTVVGAGEATITATAAEVPGEFSAASVSYVLTVEPKVVTVKIKASSLEKVYDGRPYFVIESEGLEGVLAEDEGKVTVSKDVIYCVPSYPNTTGSFTAYLYFINDSAEEDFQLSGEAAANYKVAPSEELSVTVTAKDVTDDYETTQLNVVKGVGTFAEPTFGDVTGTLAYSYDSATEYDAIVTKLAALAKGDTAEIGYTFTANGNYTGKITGTIKVTVVDIIFKVGEAEATVANALTVKAEPVYGDTWADIVKKTGTVKAVVDTHEDADQSHFTLTPTGAPNAGDNQEYKLTYTGTINGVEYKDVVVVSGTVNVGRKPITAPAQAGSVVYSGADQTYGVASTATYTVTTPAGCKNVGEYNVTIALTDKANTMWAGGTDTDLTHKLTITKAALTVKADDVQVKINGELPETYTYTVTGLKGTDTLDGVTVAVEGEVDVTKTSEYALVVTGPAELENYTVTYVNGTLAVKNNIVVIVPSEPKPDEDEPVDPEKPVVPVIGGVFTDVKADDWFAGAVEYVYENNLMEGMGNNKFVPYGETTRGQIVTILWRLEGKPLPSITNPFSDVGYSEWYSTAITWAAEHKIVNGRTETTFDPTAAITRQEIAAILYRYAQYKGYDVSVGEDTNILGYKDAFSVSQYAIPAMQWACGSGLINGIDGSLVPTGTAIRCQAATLLMRFCENVAK